MLTVENYKNLDKYIEQHCTFTASGSTVSGTSIILCILPTHNLPSYSCNHGNQFLNGVHGSTFSSTSYVWSLIICSLCRLASFLVICCVCFYDSKAHSLSAVNNILLLDNTLLSFTWQGISWSLLPFGNYEYSYCKLSLAGI